MMAEDMVYVGANGIGKTPNYSNIWQLLMVK